MQQYQAQHDYERTDYDDDDDVQQQHHQPRRVYEESNSDDEVAETLGMRQQQYDAGDGGVDTVMEEELDGRQQQQHELEGEGEENENEHEHEHEDVDDSGSFSDSLSSSPSIPDEDIDFTLVYALHTFLRTVDGQASVVKGDKLLLLDDSNSYWWLVRVLKTQAVGYIPAENIETPWERLARWNKHRNVDLTSATQQDVITGPRSTTAQTRFAGRIPPSQQPHPHESQHPSSKGVLASPSHKDHPRNMSPSSDRHYERPSSSKAKTVVFTAPVYYEHSANGESEDEEYDEETMMDEDAEGEMMQGQQVFDDDGGEESEFSDDHGDDVEADEEGGQRPVHHSQLHEGAEHQSAMAGEQGMLVNEGQVAGWHSEHDDWNGQQAEQDVRPSSQQDQYHAGVLSAVDNVAPQAGSHRAMSPAQQDSLHRQQFERQQQQDEQQGKSRRATSPAGVHLESAQDEYNVERRPSAGSIKGREINENDFEPHAPTKKMTATPPIVRDPNFDINDPFGDMPGRQPLRAVSPQRVRSVELVDVTDPRYDRLIGGNRKRSLETVTNESQRAQQTSPQQPQQPSPQLAQSVQSVPQPVQPAALRRVSNDYAHEADTSLNSMETTSSYISNQSTVSAGQSLRSSDDGHRTETPQQSSVSAQSPRKIKKGRKSDEGDGGEKKKKSGGILGLFRKKDKKKKDGDADGRSSEESNRLTSPTEATSPRNSNEQRGNGKRESLTAESIFSTDAALRQQSLEAKQAMYHQYGVQRGAGDVSNTMTPRANITHNTMMMPPTTGGGGLNSPTLQTPPQRLRPGSLMGSPSIPGLDVPLLSVLRVFAGDGVEAEAAFKTVLLNRSTTSADLVKQSMQRFRLVGDEAVDEYYLTIKELGGEERALDNEQKPLEMFEQLSQQAEAIPLVKRSSIGSINSISSNLSTNPAITRLGMNDWSDDSAVKFYLNRRIPESSQRIGADGSEREVLASAAGGSPSPAQVEAAASTNAPSYRFAVRVHVHPSDLPESVGFDPETNAVVPKAHLQERQQRSGAELDSAGNEAREKIVFFPRNVTVSEVIEAGLDRFGIVDGVVDGGDEVEDRVSKRRSVTRVKYGLAVLKEGREHMLSASSKLLEAYSEPPIFKAYDRSSKEFRRRSVDATLILGAPQDVRSSDPIFVIRRAAFRGVARPAGPLPLKIDELEERQQQQQDIAPERPSPRRELTNASDSDYATATEDEDILARAASPQATRQEIIAAQRAASRANQRALLSAQKNRERGIDINIPDRGTIRSSRNLTDDQVRYSYVDQQGAQTDISEIMQNEWHLPEPQTTPTLGSRSVSSSSTVTTTDAESFQTAPDTTASLSGDSKRPTSAEGSDDEEERAALAALRTTNVDIDPSGRSALAPVAESETPRGNGGHDVLSDAVGPRLATSPVFNDNLQNRLDRVLAKVKEDKAAGKRPPSRPRSFQLDGASSPSGRMSPASSFGGRKSPFASDGRDSPSIDQLIGDRATPLNSSTRGLANSHGKKPSIVSIASTRSSNTENLSASINADRSSAFTPNSSAESPSSARPPPRTGMAYRHDFGLETLMALVEGGKLDARKARPPRPQREPVLDDLFGRSLRDMDLDPRVRAVYEPHNRKLEDLETRLDQLLASYVSSSTPASSVH